MTTIATVANIRANTNPRAIVYSRFTGEEYSATPGDYWAYSDHDVVRDAGDEPMILIVKRIVFEDVDL